MKKYTPGVNLKHKFPGFESIKENYSQTYQDMFILTMLNGKRNGTFLEIGAQDPVFFSNTYLLETMFGWHGVSIDMDETVVENHKKLRKNTFILGDALKVDYAAVLADYPKQIDYLQVDIDPAIQSYNCLSKIPFETHRFSVITFEHDSWRGNEGNYVRTASRTIFNQNGYTLIAGNISNESHSDIFEDWWVDAVAIDPVIIEMFKRGENVCIPGDELLTIS